MKGMRLISIFLIVFFLAANVTLAGEGGKAMTEPVVEKAEAKVVTQPVKKSAEPAVEEVSTDEPGNVTLDFKDADITNVLRVLSYKSGMNIIAGKDVSGPVTIRLTNVPWEKALDVILRTYGYAYEREDNIIRVTTTEGMESEELVTEVFSLNYAKAGMIPEAIKEMLSSRGSVKFDERANLVIVTDIPTNLYKIKKVVEKLDEKTKQVKIEAKIIETTLDKNDKLGIDWTMQATASMSERPTTFPFNKKQSGGRWFPNGDVSASGSSTIGKILTSNAAWPTAVPGNFTFGTLDFSSFQMVLQMLKTRTDTKIISNPKMVTLDNQEATIHVGTTIYVPEFSESTNTGSPVFKDMKKTELQTGVKLRVTPHINSKDEIVVDIVPEVSTLGTKTSLLTTSGGDEVFAWPVDIRTAHAQIMIKDNETIVIGGLMKETETDYVNKVPILGDIPILSLFFKKKEKTIETTELLFFLTVNIIDDEGSTVASSSK
ncbi:MAG: secretin N-terminal domain-containing protein [Candidatus Omnitrophota bacterium]